VCQDEIIQDSLPILYRPIAQDADPAVFQCDCLPVFQNDRLFSSLFVVTILGANIIKPSFA
jgi:hypothetical protein